ncbi:MAG: thiamine phosphate synthase [Alistipes sp.]|nr:thiamine phosphate synthase [Alistipes sp.]
MKNNNYRLQFITHHTDCYSYVDSARLALEGGCRWVQLRMKGAEHGELEETARLVQRMCRESGATFIIDDDVLLAKRIGADGVHLGKEDMPVAEARAILGAEAIIGATVNTFDDIEAQLRSSCPDYFGCGPFRFTTTKKRLAPTLGVEGYVEIISRMRAKNIAIPLVAIGGITKADIPLLVASGVNGIALSGSVLQADNPAKEMQEIVSIINHLNN